MILDFREIKSKEFFLYGPKLKFIHFIKKKIFKPNEK